MCTINQSTHYHYDQRQEKHTSVSFLTPIQKDKCNQNLVIWSHLLLNCTHMKQTKWNCTSIQQRYQLNLSTERNRNQCNDCSKGEQSPKENVLKPPKVSKMWTIRSCCNQMKFWSLSNKLLSIIMNHNNKLPPTRSFSN